MSWYKSLPPKFLEDFLKKIDPKKEYWDGTKLLKKDPHYAMCFSERATGKTFFFQCLSIYQFHELNETTVYVRRVDKRITRSEMGRMFKAVKEKIPVLTEGVYNNAVYDSRAFYLNRINEKGEEMERSSTPFMYILPLNVQDDVKSVFNDNTVSMVWFEEFITRERYLTNEFLKFQSLISTVVRLRDNVVIVMTANTVNKFCPYFSEMGLYRVKEQKQGTIDVYRYGESELRVVVEYTQPRISSGKEKKSNVYFAFDNPQLEMVKNGEWEIASYPHPPWHTKGDELLIDDIWVCLSGTIIQGEIRFSENLEMIYALFWSTNKQSLDDILIKDNTTIFCNETPKCGNHVFYLNSGLGKMLINLLKNDKIYYSDNSTGEVFNNFVKQMSTISTIRG